MALVAVCGFHRSLGTGKSLSFVSRHEYVEVVFYFLACVTQRLRN